MAPIEQFELRKIGDSELESEFNLIKRAVFHVLDEIGIFETNTYIDERRGEVLYLVLAGTNQDLFPIVIRGGIEARGDVDMRCNELIVPTEQSEIISKVRRKMEELKDSSPDN